MGAATRAELLRPIELATSDHNALTALNPLGRGLADQSDTEPDVRLAFGEDGSVWCEGRDCGDRTVEEPGQVEQLDTAR